MFMFATSSRSRSRSSHGTQTPTEMEVFPATSPRYRPLQIPDAPGSLFIPKLLYSLLIAAACSLSLLSLYLTQVHHLTKTQMGLIFATTPIVALIGNPLATAAADKWNHHKRYLRITLSLALLLTACVTFRPAYPFLVLGTIVVSFLRDPGFPILDSLVMTMLGHARKDEYGRQRLWGSVACGVVTACVGMLVDWTGDLEVIVWCHVTLLAIFVMVLGRLPIESASKSEVLEDDDDGEVETVEFSPVSTIVVSDGHAPGADATTTLEDDSAGGGSEALFGDVTDLTIAAEADNDFFRDDEDDLFAGWQPLSQSRLDIGREDEQQRFHSAAYPPSPALSAAGKQTRPRHNSGPSYTSLPNDEEAATSDSDSIHSAPPASILDLFRDPANVSFFASVYLMGLTVSVVDAFLYLYLSEKMGATTIFLGFAKPVQVGMEVPMFYFSKQILHTVGVNNMLSLAQLILIVRLCGYFLVSWGGSVWYALPSEWLHGVFFGIMWTGAVRFADDNAPAHSRATAQGILTGVYAGLGPATGALLGGWFYDKTGGRLLVLFASLAMVNGLALILFAGCRGGGSWRLRGWMGNGRRERGAA
ncbi:major facilitator superfamily domain-containing protein [Fimicolochytrium jonesii]|uniref:major facilitator superfamily domain-containing protein n=1 Tax=Fimicolochytrium jonesii TaxID=1396493 RepID=UPI0022FE2017|nr:major facilitator superfamily domain-containing protein [Fimicolochytrium jonesii]KAI8817182.1 major facilitator superfamily domain-containing protein [Fimicolochytrium jonesii]